MCGDSACCWAACAGVREGRQAVCAVRAVYPSLPRSLALSLFLPVSLSLSLSVCVSCVLCLSQASGERQIHHALAIRPGVDPNLTLTLTIRASLFATARRNSPIARRHRHQLVCRALANEMAAPLSILFRAVLVPSRRGAPPQKPPSRAALSLHDQMLAAAR